MNYYNEFDHSAAEWLLELIADGSIPPGDVDERSITDVTATDLLGYTQCHFFAGIGGWSLALRLAGWPDNRPVWTGSCPCQCFSTAGKQRGFADERDLWPVFADLIRQCRPECVFGEQVENAIRHGWLDRVYADMEREGYAVGAHVLGAHSVGAPHRRYRLYWGAVSVADNASEQYERRGEARGVGERSEERLADGGADMRVADRDKPGLEGLCGSAECSAECAPGADGLASLSPWSDWCGIYCRDGKVRRIPAESLLLRMADGLPQGVDGSGLAGISEDGGFPLTTKKEGRAMLLKGYGNAIVPEVASEFIGAFMETQS